MTITDIRNYCGQIYAETYIREKQRMEEEFFASSQTSDISSSKEKEIESSSQKEAIKTATIEGIKHFSNVEAALIWRADSV